MDYSIFVPVFGIILSIAPMEGNPGNQFLSLDTANGPVNFIVSPETIIVDNTRLRVGRYVVAFYNSSLPVPLIYPPQYQAVLISPWYKDENILFDYFDEQLLSTSNSLKLNLSPETIVITTDGEPFEGYPGEHILIVYYTFTTKSIPPQTTPHKIIVVK